MADGWMIGVMVELPGEAAALRHYFAVARSDQARAEWAAVDRATELGRVATSPVGGQEPVQALASLPPGILRQFGLAEGAVRSLGARWPRRWLPAS